MNRIIVHKSLCVFNLRSAVLLSCTLLENQDNGYNVFQLYV